MIFLLLSVILGIFLGIYFKISFSGIFIIIILLVIGFFILSENKGQRRIFLCLILISLSFFNTKWRNEIYENREESINGTIVKEYVDKNKYVLKKDGFLKGKVLCYTKNKLNVGDRIKLSGKVTIPDLKMNYGGFDNRIFLKSQGIGYIIYADEVEKIGEPSFYFKVQNKFKNYISKCYEENLDSENADLMKSIVLAENQYIDGSVRDKFKDIGIAHILAVSGLHITIILFFSEFILKCLKMSKFSSKIISLIIVLIYIVLIGMPISALRAYLMSLFLIMSYIFKFKYSKVYSLYMSAIIILFLNPYSIFSVSFIMSYGCIFGFVLFYRRIKNYMGKNVFLNLLVPTISISIVLFPISLYFFRTFSIKTFISNVIFIPMYSAAIALSFLILVLKPIGFFISPALNVILNISKSLVDFIDSIKIPGIDLMQITLSSIILYYIIVALIYNRENLLIFKKLYSVVIVYFLFAIMIFICLIFKSFDNFVVDFLYVGQGDCSIISLNGKNYMVDTGGSYKKNFRPGDFYTLNYLKAVGISKIDKLFISHFDEDHIDGLFDIIDEVEIGSVYISYVENNIYLKELLERNISVYKLNKGDTLKLDNKTSIRVLSNPKDYMDSNDKSLVLLLRHNNFNILYTGDISKKIEEKIKTDVDFLKVSHHGSKNSTSDIFISNIRPRYAAISAGINNSYLHPAKEVMDILKKYNVKTKVTSEEGQITLVIDKNRNVEFKNLRTEKFDFRVLIVLLIYSVTIYLYLKKMEKKCNIENYTKLK